MTLQWKPPFEKINGGKYTAAYKSQRVSYPARQSSSNFLTGEGRKLFDHLDALCSILGGALFWSSIVTANE